MVGFICCSYRDYKNKYGHSSSRPIHLHLLRKGFMSNYICQINHRKKGYTRRWRIRDGGIVLDYAHYGFFTYAIMSKIEDVEGTDALAQMLQDREKDCENKNVKKN